MGDPVCRPWGIPLRGNGPGGVGGGSRGPWAGPGCAKFPGVVPKAGVPSWQRGWCCSGRALAIPEGGNIPSQQGGVRGVLHCTGGSPGLSRVPFLAEVTEHGKAAAGDLRPGDVIVTINGESTAEMLNVEAQNKIKQSPGQLRLEVQRWVQGQPWVPAVSGGPNPACVTCSPLGDSWGGAIPTGACPGSLIKESMLMRPGSAGSRYLGLTGPTWDPAAAPAVLGLQGRVTVLCTAVWGSWGRSQTLLPSLGPQVPGAISQPHQRGHLAGGFGHAFPGEPRAAPAHPSPSELVAAAGVTLPSPGHAADAE